MKKIRYAIVIAIPVCILGALGCLSVKSTDTMRPQRVGEEGLVLVRNGVSLAPIVIFKGAPPYTRGAADELVEYIEKITGARPKIIEGEPNPLPKRAIWVGYQPVMKKD